jgi:hypothetical protein
MDSWWQLGEGIGERGHELALYKITCPFCIERGLFKLVFHAEKKKPNSAKRLHFDTYECESCKGYVMVLWSASEYGELHNYKVLPWPMKVDAYPEYWPESVGRFWLQATRNLKDENWDAAAVMARSALQIALRENNAQGDSLRKEIDDLAGKGILPPIIKEWSHEVRDLGHDRAHPTPNQPPTTPEDAKAVVRFLDFLLEYLYNLPEQIKSYREKKKEA